MPFHARRVLEYLHIVYVSFSQWRQRYQQSASIWAGRPQAAIRPANPRQSLIFILLQARQQLDKGSGGEFFQFCQSSRYSVVMAAAFL